MKIPIFEEILLKGNTPREILTVVVDSKIGKVPCYLNLSTYSLEELNSTIINLEQVILENGMHPRFPYPLYIISSRSVSTQFPTVRSVKELPEHYFKKVKRPSNREMQLLNKLMLKVDKIKNLQLYKITEDLQNSTAAQKRLYKETKELYFLEKLNFTLFEKPKSKERSNS